MNFNQELKAVKSLKTILILLNIAVNKFMFKKSEELIDVILHLYTNLTW